MIIDLENKTVKVTYEDKNVKLSAEVLSKIEENWKKIEQEKSNVWNGQVFCVGSINMMDDKIEINCCKSNYAHYLYGERIGLPEEYCCRNLSAGALLETSDGYFIIGELDKLTSYPTMLQVPGGNIDKREINEENIDFMETIKRETIEEINIDLEDKTKVTNCSISKMYISENGEQPGIQIFASAKLNMNKEEMKEYYDSYYKYLIDNNLEVEFGTIHFIKSIEEFNKLTNPKRKYLLPLLKEIIC